MATPFIGEIRLFGFNFAPVGWATCSGQLLAISQNTALFSLLGTTYGGDGVSTFGLPDLRGRVPLSAGQGPGTSNYVLGEQTGSENVPLTSSQLPSHTHAVQANDAPADATRPGGAVMARVQNAAYAAAPDGATQMNAGMISPAGGSQPVPVVQPVLALNFCIALQGIFPSRN
ncbi:MAG TPA: tail fiber protein [Acidimicrobiales bacterium]|nr:tail fiber protein [Acidimicrobiales bacterium]